MLRVKDDESSSVKMVPFTRGPLLEKGQTLGGRQELYFWQISSRHMKEMEKAFVSFSLELKGRRKVETDHMYLKPSNCSRSSRA